MDAFPAYGDGSGRVRGAEIGHYGPVPMVPMSSDSGTERNHFSSPQPLHGVDGGHPAESR